MSLTHFASEAKRLQAEEAAIRARDPRQQATQRRCLACGESFASAWCGHRICDLCGDGEGGRIVVSSQIRKPGSGRKGARL